MRTNANLVGVVAILVLAAGCGSNAQPTPAASPPVARDHVSTAFATPRIAEAECARELRCRGLNTPYGSLEQCQTARGEALGLSLEQDTRCRTGGVSVTGLRDCVDETAQERCELPFRAMVAAGDLRACDAAYLCAN